MASREEIRVDVVSKYDDTGADAAIKDAALIDKLSPTLDIDSTKPTTAMGRLKKSATDTFGSISQLAIGAGVAATGAMVAFAAKAVSAFGDAAIAAGQLADASGLAIEEASRWTAVGDDIGVSADSMASAFEKLAVSLGKHNKVLEKYGIEVVTGADGQADMNATMLEAIDVINGVVDPTEKAALSQAAFGKGWADMAELIAQGSDSLKESMDQVSDSQIFDEGERAKADKYRAAMDDLGDEVEDLKLSLGEGLIPVLTVFAQTLTGLSNGLGAVASGAERLGLGFASFFSSAAAANLKIIEGFENSEEAAVDFDRTLLEGLNTFDKVHAKVMEVTDSEHAANLVALEWLDTWKQIHGEAANVSELANANFGHAPAAGLAAIAETNADRRAAALANAQDRGTTNVFLPAASPAVVVEKGDSFIRLNSMRTGP